MPSTTNSLTQVKPRPPCSLLLFLLLHVNQSIDRPIRLLTLVNQWRYMHADVWSELASRGSNIIGESIVLGLPVAKWIPRVKKLLDDTEKFHRKLDPLIDARVIMMNKGEEMPDDVLTVMVKEKVSE